MHSTCGAAASRCCRCSPLATHAAFELYDEKLVPPLHAPYMQSDTPPASHARYARAALNYYSPPTLLSRNLRQCRATRCVAPQLLVGADRPRVLPAGAAHVHPCTSRTRDRHLRGPQARRTGTLFGGILGRGGGGRLSGCQPVGRLVWLRWRRGRLEQHTAGRHLHRRCEASSYAPSAPPRDEHDRSIDPFSPLPSPRVPQPSAQPQPGPRGKSGQLAHQPRSPKHTAQSVS